MKEITEVKEIQEIAYQLLIKFHEFCEENNLVYTLTGGTALGAVRHNGFIPWDDDIDVQMPREDYDRFVLLAKDGIGADTALVTKDTLEIPYLAYAKIIDTRTTLIEDISIPNNTGVFIDIFPIDGLPSSDFEIKKHLRIMKKQTRLLLLSIMKIKRGKCLFTTLAKVILVPPARLFLKPKKIVEKIDSIARKYSFSDSEYVSTQVSSDGVEEILEKSKYLIREKILFEDREFFVPSNIDVYLTNKYGDYMKLPPEEKRVTTHGFRAYWK